MLVLLLGRRWSWVTMPVVVLLVLVVPARARAAPDSGTVLSWLSGQRERNGIPGMLTERADWSAGCAAHMSYIAQNGGVLTHEEVPGQPGYTDTGSWAGMNSILSTGTWATADHNPFENAPIHLAQMLAPALTASGVSNAPGLCITTWPGYAREAPAVTTIATYPGPGTTIYASQNVRESPFTPQAQLGIGENGHGPTIYAFGTAASGGYAGQPKLVAASLTGPSGPVPVVTADWTNPDFGAALAPGTALVIPTGALQNGATYAATVTMRAAADTQDVTRTWSFAAGATSQALPGGTLPPGPTPGDGAAPVPAGESSPDSAPAAQPVVAPRAGATGISVHVTRLGPGRLRVRLTFARASAGRAVRIDAVAAGGRIVRSTWRRVRTAHAVLRLRIPRHTVALRVRVFSGAGQAAATVRVLLR